MAKKESSDEVSSLASRLMEFSLTDAISSGDQEALAWYESAARSLAGSVLSQDETKGSRELAPQESHWLYGANHDLSVGTTTSNESAVTCQKCKRQIKRKNRSKVGEAND